jgi:hypothetical protein
MLEPIEAITGIPAQAFESVKDFSVAQRMSWASKRQTSRVEDMAYYLLGLFDVKIPLLYGEGEYAFRRLQEEIIRITSDESLFIWSPCSIPATLESSSPHLGSGWQYDVLMVKDSMEDIFRVEQGYLGRLLAPRPGCFVSSGNVVSRQVFWRKPYSMTNKGLELNTSLYEFEGGWHRYDDGGILRKYLIPLNCSMIDEGESMLTLKILALVVCLSHDDNGILEWFMRRWWGPLSEEWYSSGWCQMSGKAKEVRGQQTIYLWA